jgi:hypothetical protein
MHPLTDETLTSKLNIAFCLIVIRLSNLGYLDSILPSCSKSETLIIKSFTYTYENKTNLESSVK